MCCRLRIKPYDEESLAFIAKQGMFRPVGRNHWERDMGLSENGQPKAVFINVFPYMSEVEIGIRPNVTSPEDHEHKRDLAGAMFELAAKYAEHVNGTVRQVSIDVKEGQMQGSRETVIANYPECPMSFESVCYGFRSVFIAGGG